MIRLLVVDDSALMRRLLAGVFTAEGDFTLAFAQDGVEALERLESFRPDVVTLDLNMPRMDGMSCLDRLMLLRPCPVVLFSALQSGVAGAETRRQALRLGAADVLAKPGGAASLSLQEWAPVLVQKVRDAARSRPRRSLRLAERLRLRAAVATGTAGPAVPQAAAPLPASPLPASPLRPSPPWAPAAQPAAMPDGEAMPAAAMDVPAPAAAPLAGAPLAGTPMTGTPLAQPPPPAPVYPPLAGVVLVGVSTGGPQALDVLLGGLPAGFPWPVVVAQHMPATFTGAMARRLDKLCALAVAEVSRPVPLRAGHVYIGQGDADLIIGARPGGLVVMAAPALAGYRWHPSVERLVGTALQHLAPGQLTGVLLTGMGNDGAAGMARLRAGGGHTIAEAEETAVVWGMPGELVRAGGAERVLPLHAIAAQLRAWAA